MKRVEIAKLLMLLSCSLFLFSLDACTSTRAGVYVDDSPGPKSGPPPHAPAHGYRAKHTYHYYADAQVYFDTSRRLYFYLEGDHWRVSTSLPSDLQVQLGDYITIEMDSDQPYTQFEEHQRKYPPGQTKKKQKGKKW